MCRMGLVSQLSSRPNVLSVNTVVVRAITSMRNVVVIFASVGTYHCQGHEMYSVIPLLRRDPNPLDDDDELYVVVRHFYYYRLYGYKISTSIVVVVPWIWNDAI